MKVVHVDIHREFSLIARLFRRRPNAYGASSWRIWRELKRIRVAYGPSPRVAAEHDPWVAWRLRAGGAAAAVIGAALFVVALLVGGDAYGVAAGDVRVQETWIAAALRSIDRAAVADAPFAAFAMSAAAAAILGAVAFGLFVVAGRLRKRLRRMVFPTAERLLSEDDRAPIVLLRSFADDALTIKREVEIQELARDGDEQRWETQTLLRDVSFEEAVGDRLQRYGPLVAIGDPNEEDPLTRASRAFVSDDDWRAFVRDWMEKARYLVVICAPTDGLMWEVEQIVAREHLGKTLFLAPPSRSRGLLGIGGGGDAAEARRAAIRKTLSLVDGLTPDALGDLDRTIALHRADSERWFALGARRHREEQYERAIDLAVFQLHQAAQGSAEAR